MSTGHSHNVTAKQVIESAELANKKVQELNSKRNQQIGMQNSAQQAYNQAVANYRKLYNVDIDDTNIQQEFNRVKDMMHAQVVELQKQIQDVESGDYFERERAKNVTQVDVQTTSVHVPEPQQAFIAPTVETPVFDNPTPIATPVTPVQTAPVVEQPPVKSNPVPQATPQPTPQVKPQPVFAQPEVEEFTAPKEFNPQLNPVINQDDEEEIFTPQGWGTGLDLNQDFTKILGDEE